MKKVALLVALMIGLVAGSSFAATTVSSHIETDTVWTKDMSPINLVGDIYVRNDSKLVIMPGVIIASYALPATASSEDFGSLAVAQGSQIYVMGTADEPVIMTSAEDVATWTGCSPIVDGVTGLVTGYNDVDGDGVITNADLGDSKSGTWRPTCQEWGSVAIMGKAYISGSHYGNAIQTWDDGVSSGTNTECPGDNRKVMEGLVAGGSVSDADVLYGGTDDNDDSGEIHYLSLRYGGRDTEPNKELNGLSLGGIGRETEIDHVEVMNNIDDGIETWGGCADYEYVTIWNIGDDSFDVDEGWRGSLDKALIVQGYCVTPTVSMIYGYEGASQGSGTGDNAFEHDGAEDSDAQPVTTAKISNVTIIGQPAPSGVNGSDAGSAWRDNARVQYDNCLWIDIDALVQCDNADEDGANGYNGYPTADKKDKGKVDGYLGNGDWETYAVDGTLCWNDHWTTSYSTWTGMTEAISTDMAACGVTDFATELAFLYTDISQDTSLPLCNIKDGVYYNINKVGDLPAANSCTITEATVLPIQELTRDTSVTYWSTKDGKYYEQETVTGLNPLPAAGVTAGGFESQCDVWVEGWTAADAYGMITVSSEKAGEADLNCDGEVNLQDLSVMSSEWLQ